MNPRPKAARSRFDGRDQTGSSPMGDINVKGVRFIQG